MDSTRIRLSSDGYCEQGGQFSSGTAPNATSYKITFKRPFTTSVNSFGGFVKTSGAGSYGQNIFQNGTITLTYAIASVVAYTTNGAISHSICNNTAYWYASGY